MKKFILVLSVFVVIGSSSCKKYNCSCQDSSGVTTTTSISATSTSDASVKCAAKSSGGTSCYLQ